ncbi:MAG TPA: hypothetical protein VK789_22835 [Bryobacteraceae bacterium]|nr:hypothetical protein [Bryobacteraceae bacterium]
MKQHRRQFLARPPGKASRVLSRCYRPAEFRRDLIGVIQVELVRSRHSDNTISGSTHW